MKSKIILGLATLAALAIPSFAEQTYCRPDGDGDRLICSTTGYDAYGNYYQHTSTRPLANGYYGTGAYANGFYGNRNYAYDREAWGRREHEEQERRERIEHERHESREHHGDRDGWNR